MGKASGAAAAAAALAFVGMTGGAAFGGVVFNLTSTGLGGGSRWDAAPRNVTVSGTTLERSLSGGIRYSLQGGSYAAFRDAFSWSGAIPTTDAFAGAVDNAFAAWTATDPVSGLGTNLSFAPDLATPVVGANSGSGGIDARGAEIDLFASTDASFWNAGNNSRQAETWFSTIGSTVTLTSGTTNYPNSTAIRGADIIINNNPGAAYTLDLFRRLLTHEIGHALGFGDIEGDISAGRFIDDNYDPTNSLTAQATLTNSWASLVNTSNPAASPLGRYTVAYADPGTRTLGVDILMESRGLGIAAGNPVGNFFPLSNDDYGIRQFLYPHVPEPSGALASTLAALTLLARRRRSIAPGLGIRSECGSFSRRVTGH